MSFWQGVDVPGPALTLVVIDRIPFPRPDDPLMAARREAAGQCRVPAGRPPAGGDLACPRCRAPDPDRHRPGSCRRPRPTPREGFLRARAGQGAAADAADQGSGGSRGLSSRNPRRGHRRAAGVLGRRRRGPGAGRDRRRPLPGLGPGAVDSTLDYGAFINRTRQEAKGPTGRTPLRSRSRRNWPARSSAAVVARSSTPPSRIPSVARAAVTTGTTFCAECSTSAACRSRSRYQSRTRSSAGAAFSTPITSPRPTA